MDAINERLIPLKLTKTQTVTATVYASEAGLNMPFSGLVYNLNQYFSHK